MLLEKRRNLVDIKRQISVVKSLLIIAIIVVGFLSGVLYNSASTKVEAQSPKRLQLQAKEHGIFIWCDTDNGTVLYQAEGQGGIHSSQPITAVENKCQKNPR